MDRRDLAMAALSAAGPGVAFTPAQVQKLFFLIDREVPDEIGGPQFGFVPYDFGPFDASVYHQIEALQAEGLAVVGSTGRYRKYGLTAEGHRRGEEVLARISPKASSFIRRAAEWVRSVSFEQLVAAIYQRYPDTKANSIFRDA